MRRMSAPLQLQTGPDQCQTLQEYRDWVLGLTQAQIARTAGVTQSRISQIERGKLPSRWFWPPLLRAYQLQGKEVDFYRMVMCCKKLSALRKPVSETEPLLALAAGGGTPAVVAQLHAATGDERRARA